MARISFVVIGRNEGWRLERCLKSVTEAARRFDSEIIYVDSASTDGSVEVALGFPGVRVFEITGRYNAAIARNIGAREARGDTLFFVDGDMEVDADVLSEIYSDEGGLEHPFVSGGWVDYNYASSEDRTPVSMVPACPDTDHFSFRTGGLFLITADLWRAAGGMRNKLRRNQDFDLSVRLAGAGTLLLRRGRTLAVHHTTSPRRNLIKMLGRTLSGASLYRMVSLRDNVLNRYQWQYFVRTSYTALVLWVTVPLTWITSTPVVLAYAGLVVLRCVLRGQWRPTVFVPALAVMVWTDIILLWGLLFFWPSDPPLEYVERTRLASRVRGALEGPTD